MVWVGSGGARVGAGRPRNPNTVRPDPAAPKRPRGRPRKTDEQIHLDGIERDKRTKPALAPVVPVKPGVVVADLGLLDDYFDVAMKEGGDAIPTAEQLRNELLVYIKAHGAEGTVAPQLIQDYVINRQGYLATELVNRKVGRLTKDMKLSPYVTASANYRRAMTGNFAQIEAAIARYGNKPEPEKKNEFLALLTNRGF